MNDSIRQRARGSLLAAVCGRALAAPFADDAHPDDETFDAHAATSYPLTGDGDIALLLAYAEHLGDPGSAPGDAAALVHRFVESWRRERDRGYRPDIARQLVASIGAPEPVLCPDSSLPSEAPAVRSAPAGLVGAPLPEVADIARAGAAVTHTHPAAREGAAVLACAVALAADIDPGADVDPVVFAGLLASMTTDRELAAHVTGVAGLPSPTVDDVRARLAGVVDVWHAVPAAVGAFLHRPDDPVAVIRFAVKTGWAGPAVATMAAAIAGARCGVQALPSAWLRRLRDHDRICATADALTHRVAAAAQPA